MVPSTPGSPVAVAARAVSQEESVRSTLRMKRAAEAIALEDAQIRVSFKPAGRVVTEAYTAVEIWYMRDMLSDLKRLR